MRSLSWFLVSKLLLLLLVASTGCSMFGNRRSADRAYEQTRREIEGRSAGSDSNVHPASYSEEEDAEYEAEEERSTLGSMTAAVRELTGQAADPERARQLYVEAEAEFQKASEATGEQREELFLSAADTFKDAGKKWEDSALEQDAMFMQGESYFFADHYPKANAAYEGLLKKYPNSRYIDTVESRRFKIAQFWLDSGRAKRTWFNASDETLPRTRPFTNAVSIFDKIRLDDPTGQLADDATMAAGNAFFKEGKYMMADNFYTDLRTTFPSSEHQFKAHLLGIKTKLANYDGPQYDGDPLDEAERLIEQIRRQFPREAEAEREYLARAYAEVRYKKAERQWRMGRYFDRRREYGAAKFYYKKVVDDFNDTPLAAKAEDRLLKLADKPDKPGTPLDWLVRLVPDSRDELPPMAAGYERPGR